MDYTRIAHGISWVLHPFLLPSYFLALLLTFTAFSAFPWSVKLYFVWVVVLYTIVIPVFSMFLLRKFGFLTDYKIDIRQERIIPLLVGAVCYIMCAITVAQIPSAAVVRKFMMAAAACELVCLVVSLKWKISLHLTGMGAMVALVALLNIVDLANLIIPLALAVFGAGLLASARLYLGCHKPAQIIAGFLCGVVVSLLTVLFL